MDYVVYGTGYGATLMLLGYALRTWGPNWRFRDEDERAYARGELRSAKSAWTRFTGGLGAVIATCGMILILFTFALMLANPGDGVSETVSLVLSGLLLVGVAVWAWMYVNRFGAFGVVRAPAALTGQATEPLRYDNRPQQAAASPTPDDDADVDADDDEVIDEDIVEEDEADFEIDEDEAAELQARYSKFETHHPDGDDEARAPEVTPGEGASADVDVESNDDASVSDSDGAAASDGAPEPGSDDAEARAAKFETHHPQTDDVPGSPDDEAIEVITTVPEEAPQAVEVPADDAVETVTVADTEVAVEETAVLPAVEQDQPPASHVEEPEPVDAAGAASQPEPKEETGGRDDALRRLRERKANRTRKTDDA